MNHPSLGATCKQLAQTFAEALLRALRQAPLNELADILEPSNAHPRARTPVPRKPKPARVKRATATRRREPDETRVSAASPLETRRGSSMAKARGAASEPRTASREPRPKQKAPAAAKPEPQIGSVGPGEAHGHGAPRLLATPPEQPWTVNVSDGDQREMAVEDIILAYTSGLVTDDTFVWRIGMPEWVPLREVSEIFDRARAKTKS